VRLPRTELAIVDAYGGLIWQSRQEQWWAWAWVVVSEASTEVQERGSRSSTR
jgi:hypothetical protein